MTDRELMQQALEALEWWETGFGGDEAPFPVIAALRERLAQPEQDWDWRHPKAQALIGAKARLEIKLRLVEQLVEDPNLETTASDMEYWEPLHDKLQERLAQPEQEPVAWMMSNGTILNETSHPHMHTPLYTAPQRREWVGLTEEEVKELCAANGWDSSWQSMLFARAIEAKLKEKNT